MKFKIILSLTLLLLTSTSMFAVGFPVTRTAVNAVENTVEEENQVELTSPAAVEADRQLVAILLWLFLGGFAGHRWYLGSPIGWNILFILTAGFFIVGWIIDGVEILTGSYPGL